MAEGVYERILDLAKRRGFLYPAFDLYGGAAGFYDYGPLGAQLKALLEQTFRKIYVVEEGAAEINTPAITIEPVLKASGHVDHFSDVVVTCKQCGSGFRADHFFPEEASRILQRLDASKVADAVKKGVRSILEERLRNLKEHPSPQSAEQVRRLSIIERNDARGQVAALLAAEGLTIEVEGFKDSSKCPACGGVEFHPASHFNLMFKTHVGPGTSKVAYLRPETAQAMFVDYPYLYRYFREKLPFAAVQLGRAYRNEIAPRQGLIRLREFNQMECEAFYDPKEKTHPRWNKVKGTVLNMVPNTTQQAESVTIGDAVKKKMVANRALGYHLVLVHRLLTEAGLKPEKVRFRQHLKDEMAHYASDCWDAEFQSDRFGWVECVGVADRTDFDLKQHAQHSGKPLGALRRYEAPVTRERTRVVAVSAKLGPLFKKDAPRIVAALAALDERAAEQARNGPHLELTLDGTQVQVPRDAYEVQRVPETVAGDEFVPHVIEPSYGQDRILYAVLEQNFHETKKEGEPYTVLTLPPAMAPITVGVFPLMPKDGLDALARKVEARLRKKGLRVQYDESGAIGRRYARMDEIGTPWCVTIDYDSLKDRSVTLRDRDTTEQIRLSIGRLARELQKRLEAPRSPPRAAEAPPPPEAA